MRKDSLGGICSGDTGIWRASVLATMFSAPRPENSSPIWILLLHFRMGETKWLGARLGIKARVGVGVIWTEWKEYRRYWIGGVFITLAYMCGYFYVNPDIFSLWREERDESMEKLLSLDTAKLLEKTERHSKGQASGKRLGALIIEKEMVEEGLELGPGTSLMGVLLDAGIRKSDVIAALKELRKVLDFRFLKAGQEVLVRYYRDAADEQDIVENSSDHELSSLRLTPDIGFSWVVSRKANGKFTCEKQRHILQFRYVRVCGKIVKNLSRDMTRAGLPLSLAHQVIRAFSYDLNFQTDLRPGDWFGVLYKAAYDPKTGEERPDGVCMAAFGVKGQQIVLYRYRTNNGAYEFYSSKGMSNRKELLKTPVEGARLSSFFGKRVHPIRGYTRLHKGVDFAAPVGTPVLAAGDGVVLKAGYFGTYGKYVLLKHNAGFFTAYAHLQKYDRNLSVGKRVRQGQRIAFIGMTGMTTGPHLHFEVLKNGRQINPLSLQLLPRKSLTSKELAAFKAYARGVTRVYNRMSAK